MKEKHSTNFLIGFVIGALICMVVWYWQKSTDTDEGALDLLDRLAAAEKRLWQRETAVTPPAEPDDLQRIHGIGPVFDGRLRQAGIDAIAQLAALPAAKLAELLDIGTNRAEAILTEAVKMY